MNDDRDRDSAAEAKNGETRQRTHANRKEKPSPPKPDDTIEGEGRKRAKERGVKFGRPRKLTAHQRQEALERLTAGETQADVARSYNVDATTIGRLL